MANVPRNELYACPLCRKTSNIDDSLWSFFLGWYLDDTRRSVRFCWEQTALHASEAGHRWMSYRECLKRLQEVRSRG